MRFSAAVVLAVALAASNDTQLPSTGAFSTPATLPKQRRHRSSSSSFSRLDASTLDRQETTTSSSSKSKKNNNDNNNKLPSLSEQITNSGMASAAALATTAVNAAVSMKRLEAPDVSKSYIARDDDGEKKQITVDDEGLPVEYDKDLIERYWKKERGALQERWGYFVGKAVPFLTKLTTLFIRDGKIREQEIPALSKQAVADLQDLGPTFIKAGQMMSVRPDVLPQATLEELSKLQDAVIPFDTETAVKVIEEELGGPLGQFFTSISQEPVAAASLAQVYLATLADGKDTRVAIKVQRPSVLSTVSKDLYVLRRAAEVWQGLIERFAPQQRTNYVALLNEWAIGFYTELDFNNEASNQKRLRKVLRDYNITQVKVPAVYEELCTRRILVSEWMDGIKLSEASSEQIAAVTPAAQEAFLTQLFQAGFFHADPHPGNLLLLEDPSKHQGAELALIDCGLMARINEEDRDYMISAVIHLANKNYAALVDDFIKLGILPSDSNRAAIIPLMDKALSPYVAGGGYQRYEEELKKLYGMEKGNVQSQVGGFQAMTQDALTVLNDIPFSVPPYFAILGRAIVTLEGVALTGRPDYGIIMESYPFIARKLLAEDRPEIQKALQEVLYSSSSDDGTTDGNGSSIKLTRLLALLNNAAGTVVTQEGASFVDLDGVPDEGGLEFATALKFLLSDGAGSLRALLDKEVDTIVDICSRQILRKAVQEAVVALTPPRPSIGALPLLGDILPPQPALDEIPLPFALPAAAGGNNNNRRASIAVMTLKDLVDKVAPKLTQEEEIYAIGIAEGAAEFLGDDIGDLIKGKRVLSLDTIDVVLQAVRSGLLGRNDLLSTNSAKRVVDFVETAVEQVRRRGNRSGGTAQTTSRLAEATKNLTEAERKRLDDIVTELTQRATKRAMDRLADIERVF